MGNVCQGGVGQAPARQATIFAGKLYIYIYIAEYDLLNKY